MSSRRTAILIVAIAVGIIAVFLIVQYVNNIQKAADENNQLVLAFVATDNISRGTDGGQAYNEKKIEEKTVASQFRPATAIQSKDAIQGKVAVFTIATGTIIVEGMFVDHTQIIVSFRERLRNKNHVAISIRADTVHGVGGFLVPGDEVNMMIYQDNASILAFINAPPGAPKSQLLPEFNIKALAPENYVRAGGPQWIILGKTARYMYQKVQVLAVGSNQLLGPGEQSADAAKDGAAAKTTQSDNSLITLSVPPLAAQWVATGAAIDSGFYLSLVAQGYDPTPLQPLPVILDQFPGEEPGKLTPYAGEAG